MIQSSRVDRSILVVFVASIGLNELFHAIFDGAEFTEIVQFIQSQVLSMDSTFHPDSWRQTDSYTAAFLAYSAIWLAHAVSGVLCLIGAYQLGRAIGAPKDRFAKSTIIAALGIGAGCILYLTGFLTVASGWFALHEAQTSPPNFIREALLIFLCYVAVLLYMTSIRRDDP